jgi:hypothetical protein
MHINYIIDVINKRSRNLNIKYYGELSNEEKNIERKI